MLCAKTRQANSVESWPFGFHFVVPLLGSLACAPCFIISSMDNEAQFDITWGHFKAQSNIAKHGVTFTQAASVLLDALALTVFDSAHSDFEERWFTSTEIDFSGAKRGQFYKAGAQLNLPVYLDQKVQTTLAALASAKGVDFSAFINDLLKKDIELIEISR